MRINSKILILLVASAALLVAASVVVYHQNYHVYQTRIIEDGESWGDHVRVMVRRNIAFIREDMQLFGEVVRSELVFSEDDNVFSIGDVLLSRRFISFFEETYGAKIYEKVVLTLDNGETIASSDDSRENYSHQLWWQEAKSSGEAYRFIKNEDDRALLLVALRQHDSMGNSGVLVAFCYISSLIKDIAFSLNEYGAQQLELITFDGSLLYSTALHNAYQQIDLPDIKDEIKSNWIWQTHSEENEGQMVLLLPNYPGAGSPVGWLIRLTFDRNELFHPIIIMRWWIAGGVMSLVLLGVLLFFLIRNVQKKQAEEEQLKQQQKMLESILDGIEAGIVFIDRETLTISRASDVAGRMIGVPPNRLTGKKCYQYVCRFGKGLPETGCPAKNKKILHAEFELEKADGNKVPITKTVLEMELNGKPHFVAVMFDISYRKDIENQLAHALKLDSIGSLAAGIAHEINTPAQYIGDNLRFLKNAYASCLARWQSPEGKAGESNRVSNDEDYQFYLSEVPTAIEQSLEGVENITTTVQALKKLSHPGGQMEENDLNAILENVSVVCRNEWKYSAELRLDLDESLPRVRCNSHDISQVFLNLMLNAAHAVRSKHKETMTKGLITIISSVDGDEVVVALEDDGVGIPVELQDRVFDPFFTTKEVGEGSGQGLSICYAIVKRHSGDIRLKSEPGKGTKVTVILPINDSERD